MKENKTKSTSKTDSPTPDTEELTDTPPGNWSRDPRWDQIQPFQMRGQILSFLFQGTGDIVTMSRILTSVRALDKEKDLKPFWEILTGIRDGTNQLIQELKEKYLDTSEKPKPREDGLVLPDPEIPSSGFPRWAKLKGLDDPEKLKEVWELVRYQLDLNGTYLGAMNSLHRRYQKPAGSTPPGPTQSSSSTNTKDEE